MLSATALLVEKLSRHIAISLLPQVVIHYPCQPLVNSKHLRVRLSEDLLPAALNFDAALVTAYQSLLG